MDGSKGRPAPLLTAREQELVSLGAAMGSNCIPCIEHHVPASIEAGLTEAQVREAIRIADKLRQAPARKSLDTATRLLDEIAAKPPAGKSCCA